MRGAFRAILRGGLLAGVLDILAAFVVYGFRGAVPMRILQSIASGLLGAEAFEGGLATAVLGGLLHFFIACGWAVVYYGASRRLGVLSNRPVLSGTAYGAAVYFIMNLWSCPSPPFRNARSPSTSSSCSSTCSVSDFPSRSR